MSGDLTLRAGAARGSWHWEFDDWLRMLQPKGKLPGNDG